MGTDAGCEEAHATVAGSGEEGEQMSVQLPVALAVAVFEVTSALHPYLVGDRILVRPGPRGVTYELYRRLRAEDVEEMLTPRNVELTATEPLDVFSEAARLFARSPSLQLGLRRLK